MTVKSEACLQYQTFENNVYVCLFYSFFVITLGDLYTYLNINIKYIDLYQYEYLHKYNIEETATL